MKASSLIDKVLKGEDTNSLFEGNDSDRNYILLNDMLYNIDEVRQDIRFDKNDRENLMKAQNLISLAISKIK